MKNSTTNFIGWVGVVAILVAYALVSFKIVTADNLAYQALNIIGSIGIVIKTATVKDYQPMALNIAWALIALISLIRIAFL